MIFNRIKKLNKSKKYLKITCNNTKDKIKII